LRPLSAKLLPPTIPELEGKIDREKLESIEGRSRHRQIALAKEFGLKNYPAPASGCLLTDPEYSRKLRDLLAHNPQVTFNDLNFLQAGRHFRLSPDVKVMVGRSEQDNAKLAAFAEPRDWVLEVPTIGSPTTVVRGPATEEHIEQAAQITARYSDMKDEAVAEVMIFRGDDIRSIRVKPGTVATVRSWRV
jgi:hypothetical protein